jgi:hypothetical protein
VKHSKKVVLDPRIERDEKVAQKASAAALKMSGGNKQRARETLAAVRNIRRFRRRQEDILAEVARNNERAFQSSRRASS